MDGFAQRLLSVDVFARFRGGDGGQSVPMVGRGDHHRVDVGTGHEFPEILIRLTLVRAAVRLRLVMGVDAFSAVFPSVGIYVANGYDLRA